MNLNRAKTPPETGRRARTSQFAGGRDEQDTHAFVVVGMMLVGGAVQEPRVGAQAPQARTLQEFAGNGVHAKTAGVQVPKLLRQVDPKYAAVAMRAKVEGQVKLFAIVGVDGRIERSQVSESLHPDLDAEAIRALAQWQ